MPPVSQAQQKAAGMARAAKKGEIPVSQLKGAALEMYKSMTKKETKEFATLPKGKKRKDLPRKVKKESVSVESCGRIPKKMKKKKTLREAASEIKNITAHLVMALEKWGKKTSVSEKKKPSAGLSKKQRSSIAKRARKGEDIGKKGKGFKKVEAAARKGGARDPKAVAAAAMWKQQAKAHGESVEAQVPPGYDFISRFVGNMCEGDFASARDHLEASVREKTRFRIKEHSKQEGE